MNKQVARNLLRAIVHVQVRFARLSRFGKSGETVFRHTWEALHKRKLVTHCASQTRHRFQPDAAEVLLLEVLDAMRAQGMAFQPPHQTLASDTILAMLDSGRAPIIVATSHTGFSTATHTLLRKGLAVTLVADALPPAELAARYQRTLDKYPKFRTVPKDRYCLGRLRDALREERTISCAADFQDENTKTYSLISTAIFEFARRMEIGLVMAKTVIDDDGSITTVLDGPHRVTDALAYAEAFIDFLNAGRRVPKKLSISRPPPVS